MLGPRLITYGSFPIKIAARSRARSCPLPPMTSHFNWRIGYCSCSYPAQSDYDTVVAARIESQINRCVLCIRISALTFVPVPDHAHLSTHYKYLDVTNPHCSSRHNPPGPPPWIVTRLLLYDADPTATASLNAYCGYRYRSYYSTCITSNCGSSTVAFDLAFGTGMNESRMPSNSDFNND